MTTPRLFKQSIAVLAALVILFIGYYGSYLPYRKSHAFIVTLGGRIGTLKDLKQKFGEVLDMPSPIGHAELTRNFANTGFSVIEQVRESPEAIRSLMDYIETRYRPLIERGRGMSFLQDLFLLGTLNREAFARTGDVRYLEAAKKYYREGYAIGSTRPQFVYGLFDLYRMENNVPKVKEMAEQILRLWPTDEATRNALEEFLKPPLTTGQ